MTERERTSLEKQSDQLLRVRIDRMISEKNFVALMGLLSGLSTTLTPDQREYLLQQCATLVGANGSDGQLPMIDKLQQIYLKQVTDSSSIPPLVA